MMRIRRDDLVEVIAGDDRGERGRVLSVDRESGKVIVEQIGLVYKHVRRSQRNPQGGRLSIERPIFAGNVMYVCESCDKTTRLGVRHADDGSKERFCKRCGASAGVISPAKARYAKK